MSRKYCDSHMHEVGTQESGFLIALDGAIIGEGYLNNEVQAVAKQNNLIPVQYVTSELGFNYETKIVKYHPRIEKYTCEEVNQHIRQYSPKAVIIDTLNQPYWKPDDYWKLAMEHPKTQFLFAHAGGFDIVDFVKIVMFQKNAWIDFSHTQHYFGWCAMRNALPLVVQHIDYALKEDRVYNKLLFGLDNTNKIKVDCDAAISKYEEFGSCNLVLKDNFYKFLEQSKL